MIQMGSMIGMRVICMVFVGMHKIYIYVSTSTKMTFGSKNLHDCVTESIKVAMASGSLDTKWRLYRCEMHDMENERMFATILLPASVCVAVCDAVCEHAQPQKQ